eukprot:scaffold10250_cov48-Phaeocystis_antarctica.AAC.2
MRSRPRTAGGRRFRRPGCRPTSAQPRVCTSWRYRLPAVLAAVVREEHERAPLLLDLAQEVALRRR